MTKVNSLLCYLMREDGEWYELGNVPEWRLSFAVFPGPIDGSVTLTKDDTALLALRIDGHNEIAADIIRWANGMSIRFMSELDPQVEPGVSPTPITGSALSVQKTA